MLLQTVTVSTPGHARTRTHAFTLRAHRSVRTRWIGLCGMDRKGVLIELLFIYLGFIWIVITLLGGYVERNEKNMTHRDEKIKI